MATPPTVNPTHRAVHHTAADDAPLTIADRAPFWFEQNKRMLLAVLGVVLALAAIVVGVVLWRGRQADQAQERVAESVRLFEQAQGLPADQTQQQRTLLERALRDEGQRLGLKTVADDYGSTEAGNLAAFYTANALYALGRNDEALRYFGEVDGGTDYLAASALAGEGAVLENQNKPAEAAAKYAAAADRYESDLFTPGYLLAAVRAYDAAGNVDAARAALDRIRDDYPLTPESAELEYLEGRLDAKAGAAPAPRR